MKQPERIRAILFDLDNTLHDRASSLRDFISRQHDRLELAEFVSQENWSERFIELDADGLIWKDKVYQTLTAEVRIPYSWPQLLADYEIYFPKSAVLFDGGEDLIANLRARGFLLGLITNGRTAFQQSVIEALGLDKVFDSILVSEAEGVLKPEAEIFNRALARLGVTNRQAVFVGDSLSADIEGARNANIFAVWKCNNPNSALPQNCDHVITHLSELLLLPTFW